MRLGVGCHLLLPWKDPMKLDERYAVGHECAGRHLPASPCAPSR